MNIPDGDHVLTQGGAWLDVEGFAIRIHTTDEGIAVDIFDDHLAKSRGDYDAALLTSAYALTSELKTL